MKQIERLDVRTIITICNGCGRELTHKPDGVLEGAEALIGWMQTHLRPCICGAKTCDVKIPIVSTTAEQE